MDKKDKKIDKYSLEKIMISSVLLCIFLVFWAIVWSREKISSFYVMLAFVLMLVVVLTIFFTVNDLLKQSTNRQLLVKNAEIKSLQNQINAHFMYNVLETIKMMAEIKEDYEISDAITKLGDMFRYSMQWTSGMVKLKDEIKYISDYLNLLNLRFDYEIYLSLNIPKKLMDLKIPKMSLQPLVENSVYHGIEYLAEDTSIYIKAFVKDDLVSIEVLDAGCGIKESELIKINKSLNESEGINEEKEHGRALYNVNQRVKMYFGSEYGLRLYSKEGAYTKALIQFPYDKE